jgi:hypothetical protein
MDVMGLAGLLPVSESSSSEDDGEGEAKDRDQALSIGMMGKVFRPSHEDLKADASYQERHRLLNDAR